MKNDKIESLTMEYTWNGMECSWNVHGVFHMEWCINYDKVELIPHLSFPPWQLFHAIFHSFWHVFQSNFHFFMAATSFSLVFCLIPPWQLFHATFHSSWHVFHRNFHFFMVATSFFLQILSHSSLAAISCNISFLLAFISIKF